MALTEGTAHAVDSKAGHADKQQGQACRKLPAVVRVYTNHGDRDTKITYTGYKLMIGWEKHYWFYVFY